jgi:cytidine kinase
MIDFVTFGIILDEVVLAGGRHIAGVLGGGGPQTAFGMRLWTSGVGLAANVGADLDAAAWEWLNAAGLDTTGIVTTTWPTLRATQRLDAAGHRAHEWQVPGPAIGAQLARSVAALPEAYKAARGFHLGLHPEEPDLALLADLRALGAVVSVEPFRRAERPLTADELRALVSAADIFSPNAEAAVSLVGAGTPLQLAQRLGAAGAPVVAVRLGEHGSLVYAAKTGAALHIPAVPVRVAQPVGAGNAYCGGFLTGWVETGDLRAAGLRGAVAASFLLEQVGLPMITPALRQTAQARYAALNERVLVVAG